MKVVSLLILCIAGCAPGGDGAGEVRSTEDAPWSMDAAATFLWRPAENNDGGAGQGGLFISVDSLKCSDVDQTARGVRDRKRGLLFRLGYKTHKDPQVDPPAWDGLYMTGGADTMGQVVQRTLDVEAWNDGSIFVIDGESWVDIDEGKQSEFRGTFSTPWWSGSFAAEVCPDGGNGAVGDDTGS